MRIGNPSNNEFVLELNKINQEIQVEYLKKIIHVTRSVNCDVMLGDSTTKKVETFDIKNVETFFARFGSYLSEWNSQGVTYSSDEDLRRIFTKAEIRIGDYIISLHTSLQYHVLLYYKPIQRVIELQKRLAELIDINGNSESKYEDEGERLIIEKLNELGFKDMPKQELFELFYNDEELAKKIKKMIDDSQPEVVDVQGQKNELFKELDNLLIETFHTTSVIIDEQKLVNGEEGCLCNIDLEYVDNGAKQGLVDASQIDEQNKNLIKQNITKILDIVLENNS
ncbi:hypothetical protein OAI67_00545 [Candidatus Nitrosopelagicus sp.]|nr:hypothetical protein [Candidatus Nitrosopelagicus sp.]